MSESIESRKEQFVFPNIGSEYGEFERVSEKFGFDDVRELIKKARQGKLISLSEDLWWQLDNTDSFEIAEGDFELVGYLSQQVKRDCKSLHAKMTAGAEIDAPIVMKHDDNYHLVSGNTRLMVARASGIRPTILLFEA